MTTLVIHLDKIVENYRKLHALCSKQGRELVAVTKICSSERDIVAALAGNGCTFIADTSADSLSRIADIPVKKLLLKVRLSETEKCLEYSGYGYLSELKILEELGARTDRKHPYNVLLAVELGDYREGILGTELPSFVEKALKVPGVRIEGIAGNLGCLMGKLASPDVLDQLSAMCSRVKHRVGFEFPTVSLGGTVIYDELFGNALPPVVNQIRMGEAFFFGYNMSKRKFIPGFHHDAFELSGEILEIKEKRVGSRSGIGYNAFGKKIEYRGRGVRRRAVIDFGEIVCNVDGLRPEDGLIRPVGATHDYLVMDITDSEQQYRVGDNVRFFCNYNSAAQAFISGRIEVVRNRLEASGARS